MVELVAEIGINHNASVEIAKKLIDVAASAGCHYVKFQKRDIDLVYTKEELDAPRKSPWGETNRDQKNALEFGWREYQEIGKHCKSRNIEWFASPWDLHSIQFLKGFFLQTRLLKIPSAMITDKEYLQACRDTHMPLIISTGMSTYEMIDECIEAVGQERIYCLMHCTSTYPSKPEELNLNCIRDYKIRYPWAKIGFSNHNPGIIYMPIAAALGAEMIEFHITLDRSMYGSDQAASIEPEGVHRLAKYIKGVSGAMGDGVKRVYESEIPIMKKLRRAI